MPIVCKSCGSDVSPTWWKCCPKHTTERGRDVVCQNCANVCLSGQEVVSSGNEVLTGEFTLRDGSTSEIYVVTSMLDPRVVTRLINGDWSFGCAGIHNGHGTKDCPRELHHHHDEFCNRPTNEELRAAGIDPKTFKPRSRR